jgi:uncharacterized membrane protein HdeD (DUF308 family)
VVITAGNHYPSTPYSGNGGSIMSTQLARENLADAHQIAPRTLARVYLVRGIVALAWVVAFAAVSGSLSAGAAVLLVIYPLIDVVASAFDARLARPYKILSLQTVNAACSLLAAIAIGLAAADDTAAVLHVFGVWAFVSGAIQLVVALKRRATFGTQWTMLISGGLSMVAGVGLNVLATADTPKLTNLTGYGALGAAFFIAGAVVLIRRSR